MREFLAGSWLVWGAVLPIFAGLVLAPVFGAEPWVGAVVGGLIALPLSLLGLHLSEQLKPPPLPADTPPVAAPPDDRPDWQTTVGKVLLCLLPVTLGVAGLVTGTSVIVIPGGHQSGSNPALMWTVSGPLGRVVALGLLALGLGGLAKLRVTGKSPLASWAIGLGLLLALGGSLIHGLATVVERWLNR